MSISATSGKDTTKHEMSKPDGKVAMAKNPKVITKVDEKKVGKML